MTKQMEDNKEILDTIIENLWDTAQGMFDSTNYVDKRIAKEQFNDILKKAIDRAVEEALVNANDIDHDEEMGRSTTRDNLHLELYLEFGINTGGEK